jgi:hypothetical protein
MSGFLGQFLSRINSARPQAVGLEYPVSQNPGLILKEDISAQRVLGMKTALLHVSSAESILR